MNTVRFILIAIVIIAIVYVWINEPDDDNGFIG